MTPTELDILMAWSKERHEETMDRFDRLDQRLVRLEDQPRLTPEQVVKMQRAAERVEGVARTIRWLGSKRVALLASIPSTGGAIYLFNWLHDVFR